MSIAPPAPSKLAPGFRLDRYELICPVAEGGMASVWIARQTGKHGFQKLVGIKTILPKYAADPHFQSMFVDEARIASRIEHVNVAQILDVGEQHEVTYLVMEYVDGDSLSKLTRAAKKTGAPIPHGVLLRILADVCGGLHAAHELKSDDGEPLGVVHRDVSPQNVLVSTRGVAKLIDFGIAKARDRLSGDTNTDQLKGKVQYMAPEQALGRALDRRADVWAVGAVLHHLLAGRPPFEAENEVQTLFLLTSGRPAPPLRGAHPAVAAVVRKALTHDPDARYETAALLQKAIEEAMLEAGLPTTTATVAEYLASLVGDRTERRKEAISLGLRAADERDKYADLMRANADATGSNGSLSGARIQSAILGPSEPSSATGQTLGSAAVDLPVRERGRGVRFALYAMAAMGLVASGALVAAYGPGAKHGAETTTASPGPTPASPGAGASAATSGEASATAPPSNAPAASTAAATPDDASVRDAAPSRPVWTPPVRWTPPPPAATATAPAKTRINDGF